MRVILRLIKLIIAVVIIVIIAWLGMRFIDAWNESAGATMARTTPAAPPSGEVRR